MFCLRYQLCRDKFLNILFPGIFFIKILIYSDPSLLVSYGYHFWWMFLFIVEHSVLATWLFDWVLSEFNFLGCIVYCLCIFRSIT